MQRLERIASGALVALGLFVAFYAHQFLKIGMMLSPGAGFLPFCIGIALIILGAIWFIQTSYARKAPVLAEQTCGAEASSESTEPYRTRMFYRFMPGVILVIIYAWLLERAGYLLSTTLFMLGWQKVVERQGWLKTAVIAILSAGAMHTLFSYLLRVFLPAGIWFD